MTGGRFRGRLAGAWRCVPRRGAGTPAILAAVAVAVACGMLLSCGTPGPRYGRKVGGATPDIRVLLDQGRELELSVTGSWRVRSGGGELLRGSDPTALNVRRSGDSIEISAGNGEAASAGGAVEVLAPGGGRLETQNGAWPGVIRIVAYGHASLLMINVVPVEVYLEGVVPHEIGNPGADAYAAVEAQAVAARTYALGRMSQRKSEPFDVYAGIRDQVYRGTVGHNRLSTSAVRDTRGVVLRYNGRLARCYYSATCGGHTSDIRRVWPDREPAPYLYGIRDREDAEDSFCSWVHNFRWRYTFTGRDLGRILRSTIPKELRVPPGSVGFLEDIAVVERSRSGRARVVRMKTSGGEWTATGDRIRWILSPDPDGGRILPGTLFDLEVRRKGGRVVRVDIIGGGNGHGVGMCQNGAIGMARRGYSWRMVLHHYYPGATIGTGY